MFLYQPDNHSFLHNYFIPDPEIQAFTQCNMQSVDSVLVKSLLYMHSFKAAIKIFPRNMSDFNVIVHTSKIPTREYCGHYNTISTRKIAV